MTTWWGLPWERRFSVWLAYIPLPVCTLVCPASEFKSNSSSLPPVQFFPAVVKNIISNKKYNSTFWVELSVQSPPEMGWARSHFLHSLLGILYNSTLSLLIPFRFYSSMFNCLQYAIGCLGHTTEGHEFSCFPQARAGSSLNSIQSHWLSAISYHCLFVSFLDCVAQDLCIAIVLWRCPLQGCIKTPDIYKLYTLRRTRLVCRGDVRKKPNKQTQQPLASGSRSKGFVISSHAGKK